MIKRLISEDKRQEIKKKKNIQDSLINKLEKLGLTKEEIDILIKK